MKKSRLILLPILAMSIAGLFSCDNNNNEQDQNWKANLSLGDYTLDMIHFSDFNYAYKYDLTYQELKEKIGKESFAVAVGQSGCFCWNDLAAVINNYVNNTHIVVYRIKTENLLYKDDFGLKVVSGSSSFGIFKLDGSVKAVNHEDKETSKQDKFNAFMNKYTSLPRMYYISENDISNKVIKDNVNATIYFGRSGCPDCSDVNKLILFPYFENHSGKTLYCYDLDEYYGTDNYIAKKGEFKLTAASNPTYGYGDGFVPTFFYYNNKEIKSGAVAFNDKVESNIITRSYYTSERAASLEYLNNFTGTKIIQGMNVPSSDLTAYGNWENDKAVNYYKPLITAFLDYALPNTNLVY